MKNSLTYIASSDTGITLVELMVVVCIICIILGVSIPNIKSLGSGLVLKIEAIQIVQDIRYTQQLALTRGENYKLQMNKAEKNYYIKPTKALKSSVKRVNLHNDIYVKSSTWAGSANYPYIEFNSKTGIPGRTGSIELSDNYGNTRKIAIAVGTGRVRIE